MKTADRKTCCPECGGKGFRASRHAANLTCSHCSGTGVKPTATRKAALERIAKEKLGLETLETRRSDSLDFSDQAVWTLEAALAAAYEAGRQAAAEPAASFHDLERFCACGRRMRDCDGSRKACGREAQT